MGNCKARDHNINDYHHNYDNHLNYKEDHHYRHDYGKKEQLNNCCHNSAEENKLHHEGCGKFFRKFIGQHKDRSCKRRFGNGCKDHNKVFPYHNNYHRSKGEQLTKDGQQLPCNGVHSSLQRRCSGTLPSQQKTQAELIPFDKCTYGSPRGTDQNTRQ